MVKAILLSTCISLGLSACSLEPVQPWDRDLLAQQKMQLVADPLEIYLDEHTYFSKEASSGGQSVGGGGCGCN
ncbi:hypothetical protein MNBD_GAMMA19-1805 [hydrothermal vent metagenome]|uniref:DUF4266 domain-containing protein n=1 Tax=hydrothermal vent metagenome TaxID=652676 RepID=A0A3B1A764_9ZZZZ